MTRTITLLTATVGAALLFAVPAMADNWGVDQQRPDAGYLNPDAADRAASAKQQHMTNILNASAYPSRITSRPVDRERALGTKNETKPEQPVAGFDARSDGLNRIYGLGKYEAPVVGDDRFRIDPSTAPSPVTVTSSGTQIEWGQIGIGFGIGLVLALGLYLAVRFARIRPLAH